MFLILLGAPGAGKGTQAARLATHLGLAHLSTGDMFRDIISNPQTPLEKEIKATMDRGDLVNDDMTINLVKERIALPDCAKGVILDGFPRTAAQAEALDQMLEEQNMPSQVILLETETESLIERKAGRLYAPESKKVYHVKYSPPKVEGRCDASGEALIQREDDKPEATRHRLKVYEEQTAPVVAYYAAQNRLQKVDGMASMDEVFNNLMKKIEDNT